MSLLPFRLLINDPIPTLGKLVRPVEPEQGDRFASFYANTSVALPDGTHTFITEADCRQIKPKWFGYGTNDGVHLAAEECMAAAEAFVQQLRQAEFLASITPSNGAAQASKTEKVATTPPLPEAAPPVVAEAKAFKPGDRVREIGNPAYWQNCTYIGLSNDYGMRGEFFHIIRDEERGCEGGFYESTLELIPEISPKTEPNEC